ncbi:hypothetical protein TELCIR_18247, partial [Teladorsagia circumcincta]
IYSRGKIRCALHGSCYNVKTGDIEDYPTFDSLHTYEVKEQDGDLIINTTEKQLESERRTRMCNIKTLSNETPIIVVGGGVSASAFVEHARLNGCAAPITMISEDENPPYDRTKLSKKPGVEAKDVRFRSDDYYKESHIDIMLKTKNVYTLRVVSDASTIAAQSAGKNVVCIGASFIGTTHAKQVAMSSTDPWLKACGHFAAS